MKPSLVILFIMISTPVFAGEPFSVPHDVDTLSKIETNLDSWSGRTLGFVGRVEEIRLSYGKPSYKLLLKNPNQNQKTIWVSSLLALKASDIDVGQIIRVAGFLDKVKPDDASLIYNHTGYHLLGFCFVNQETKAGYYLPSGVKQCKRWEAGEHPEELINEKP